MQKLGNGQNSCAFCVQTRATILKFRKRANEKDPDAQCYGPKMKKKVHQLCSEFDSLQDDIQTTVEDVRQRIIDATPAPAPTPAPALCRHTALPMGVTVHPVKYGSVDFVFEQKKIETSGARRFIAVVGKCISILIIEDDSSRTAT